MDVTDRPGVGFRSVFFFFFCKAFFCQGFALVRENFILLNSRYISVQTYNIVYIILDLT